MRHPGLNLRSTAGFVAACERLRDSGHGARVRADGWSMYPAIRPGDILEIVPVESSDIRVGDVLLSRLGSGSVAHRVVAIQRHAHPLAFVLRGDAAFGCDAPVSAADVLGKVTAVTRNGARWRIDTLAARLAALFIARLWRVKRRLVAGREEV